MNSQSLLPSRTVLALTTFLVLLASSIFINAQQGSSTVRGTVKDPQDNVVTGATVTLTNVGTTSSRTTTTSDSGNFSFEQVPVGDYRLEVESKGFKKALVTGVHASVAAPTAVDVQLELGNVSEVVTVAAGSAEMLVNREDATLGNNFVNKQITQLPLEARSIPNLLTLQAATTRDGYVAGARADQSNITLDGVDINEAQTNQIMNPNADPANGSNALALQPDRQTVIRLNSEAIEEFRVTTSNPNANQGRSAGAQVALITKSGSNDWHGAAFEFYRTSAFSANNFFNNKAGSYGPNDLAVITGGARVGDKKVPRPPLIRHTFGGAFGGPIARDRAFFFYSLEGDRITQSSSVLQNVPLASLGRGEVKYPNSSGGVTTLNLAQLNTIFTTSPLSVGMNPVAVSALAAAAAKYPANDFTIGDGFNTAGYRFSAPVPVKRNSHSAKFDFNINSKQQAFVRVNVIYDLIARERQFPDTAAPNIWSHPMSVAGGHTWTIHNNLINNVRYGFTREAFTSGGDSNANSISFRFVFSPLTFSRTLTRVTPVQNITDDLSWIKGSHSFGFGTNIRLISNRRTSFANAYDSAVTNPSFYSGGGNAVSTPINNFSPISGSRSGVQNAVTALIGRFSQYSANFTFGHDGTLQAPGTPSARDFRTQEYDAYMQDSWKLTPQLTVTYGLRYSISHPVYEKNGFEVVTDIPLSDVLELRKQAAIKGQNYQTPLQLILSGPANHGPSLYNWDKNNFQPRAAFAWSPAFKSGFLGRLFGTKNQSVVRGGFAMTNDYYGQQLAVSFDLNNTLGFSSGTTIAANTFNVSSRPAPLFTGFGQAVRPLPRITVPGNISFPRTQPFDPDPLFQQRRIESTLDSKLVAPVNYSWNLTYERELGHGLVVQTSYVGRLARNLIASRDVMALNNLNDPKSGIDWYTAAGQLERLRAQGVPSSAIQQSPFFANFLPANIATLMNDNYFGNLHCADPTSYCIPETFNQTQAVYDVALNFYGNDWTDTQDVIEAGLERNIFFHPQYGALSAFSSIAKSNYHAGTLTIRERLGRSLTMDLNYTLSHSHDDASGLQTSTGYGEAFILNPLRQHDQFAESDFDIRQIINANAVWEIPIGRGRKLFRSAGSVTDAILGGWQLSGIYRWNTGLPISSPYDDARWATNWNAQSNAVRIANVKTCPTQGGKLFGCNTLAAYKSFRNPLPGETGDRNNFRLPGYINLDLGLGKTFNMPWSEKHKLQVRFEAFNVTNTQRMGAVDGSRTGYGITLDPATSVSGIGDIPSNWSNFTGIQGQPRVMQLGVRYSF
ncbi:MAG: Cna protein B-type domain protein [Acidobacteria bacterium]|nr:Cna protein B-type domain protein [Acidobacteriota bacterium]